MVEPVSISELPLVSWVPFIEQQIVPLTSDEANRPVILEVRLAWTSSREFGIYIEGVTRANCASWSAAQLW